MRKDQTSLKVMDDKICHTPDNHYLQDSARQILPTLSAARLILIAGTLQIENLKLERALLERLNHPGIVNFYFTFQDPTSLYFGLEVCPKGVSTGSRQCIFVDDPCNAQDDMFGFAYAHTQAAGVARISADGVTVQGSSLTRFKGRKGYHLMMLDSTPLKLSRS